MTQQPRQDDTLIQLKRTRDELLLRREIAELRQINHALTAESLSTAVPELVDPLVWRTDGFGRQVMPIVGDDTRRDGRNRPLIETEQDLDIMRALARLLTQVNTYGVGALETLTDFVIGEGFSYNVAADSVSAIEADEELIRTAQKVVDEFLDDNDWICDFERELFARSRVDGEFFLRLHHLGGGRVQARVVEPEFVTEPLKNVADLEAWLEQSHPTVTDEWGNPFSWSFGIHTPARDVQDSIGYFVQWSASGADWDYVPRSEMEHMKLNVPRNVKRGMSDFFPVQLWLDRGAKLLRNTISGATVQSAIAGIRQFPASVTESGVRRFVDERASRVQRERLATGGTRSVTTEEFDEATILNLPEGQNWMHGPMGNSQSPIYLEVLQAALRAAATRWRMPEYMISSDASNANYSSTLVAGTPFTRMVRAQQKFYRTRFSRVLWKVLRMAYSAGRFDRFQLAWPQLKAALSLQVEGSDPEMVDRTVETQRRAVLHDAGVLSRETWAAQEGLDWESEREQMGPVDEATLNAAAEAEYAARQVEALEVLESLRQRAV